MICECGFLSNPTEAQLLTEETYQEKVADAVCSGILDYLGQKSDELT
ncbi:MAG: N-acetylmuramoyl-L-alanine amidase [Lachnospiraceae bacterium]|nr:N-acetylmuramoyl-L-alanine amidase [Lachnospiraceae bacterium]